MSTRKRRRDHTFSDDEPEAELLHAEEANMPDKQKEKEQEVWDAIRETHYEAIEQLPLTLERQLSLMRKLDDHSSTLTSRLFPMLQRYITQRQAMTDISENDAEALDHDDANAIPETVENAPAAMNGHLSQTNGHLTVETPSRRLRNGALRPSPRTSTPSSAAPELQKNPQTTKELLSHVAWLSEEILRASQEKVNLAQTNYDSVDRHIRLLDQAIEEQVASLSLEKSRHTTGIAVHLPELVVPEYKRKRSTVNIVSDDDLDTTHDEQHLPVAEPKKAQAKGKRSSKKKGKGKGATGRDDQSKGSISLTITLPATTQQDDIDVQLNEEPLYCYCNRVSFGEMIACDNESCKLEWFHLGCVGLTEIPEGEWYCENCRNDEA